MKGKSSCLREASNYRAGQYYTYYRIVTSECDLNLTAPCIAGRGDLHEFPLLQLAVELVWHELLDVGHLHLVRAGPRQRLSQLPLRHLQPELRFQVLLLDLLLFEGSCADLWKH